MVPAYNHYGYEECRMTRYLAEEYNRTSDQIRAARLWGPCGGSLSKLEGCRDPEYAKRLQNEHDADLADLWDRQAHLVEYAKEMGQWDDRAEDIWIAARFTPGGKRPKGWHLVSYPR